MGKIADTIRGFALPEQNKKKLLSLDQEFVNMEAEIQTLKAENLRLQAQVNPLQRDVDRLKNEIEQSLAKGHDKLDELEIKILVALSQSKSRLNVAAVAAHLQTNPTRAEYF